MRVFLRLSLFLFLASLCACASVPEIPTDRQYPVEEILRYAVCELQAAYRDLDDKRRFPLFHAREYAIKVQLQPKADFETTARVGATGKTSLMAASFFSGALGGAPGAGGPGAGIDATGHQDGSVSYLAKSSALIAGRLNQPLDCTSWSPSQHVLANHLDIRDWLERSADPASRFVGPFAVDGHTFTADVTIQWDAAGLFTYNFPLGTAFATASGRYKLDEMLQITITHDEQKVVIKNLVTLPGGIVYKKIESVPVGTTATIAPETRLRLDLQGVQQSLQNLQITVPR